MKLTKIIKLLIFFLIALLLLSCSFADITLNINTENIVKSSDFTVAVLSDTQAQYKIIQKLVDSIILKQPDVVFHVGDMVDFGIMKYQWDRFNKITKKLREIAEFFPALGNHDLNSKWYYENFDLPNNERWYSVERNNMHFIVLDSNASMKIDSEQYKWLEEDLKKISDSIKFRIIFFHHPILPWDSKRIKNIIPPLLEKYKVNIVFNGHEHNYERFFYNGIYYVTTGGGGGVLDDQGVKSEYSQAFSKKHHFCELFIKENKLVVNVFDINLNLIDNFEMEPVNSLAQ